MENEESPGATLRDDLSAAFDAAEAGTLGQAPEAPPIDTTPAPAAGAAPVEETSEQKAGRTAGRPRDAQGRLLPGKATPPDAAPQVPKPDAALAPGATAQPAPAVPAPSQVQRPSGMKKEHWASFDKIAAENPAFASYLIQRDRDYAQGVSTYKQEWDTAKPLLDAVAPFMPQLRQHGIDPAQWVSNLGNAHQRLVTSNPQDKLALFQKLAADYQIPAQLAVQGQDGQWQLLGQLPPPQQQPQQQQSQQQPIESVVQQVLQQERMKSEVEQFWNNKEKYPYAEQVRETMAGLLHAELADDLNDAYEQALHLPRHADLLQAQRDAQLAKDEAERAAKAAAQVAGARAKTISPRSSTPSAPAGGGGKKGLRDELSEQYDAHATGRV